MRALWVLLLLFTVSMAAAQDDASQTPVEFTDHPARVVTNINGLNVRRTPAIETDNIVGRLQPGQQVHVLAREGDWQQVRSEGGLFGWSHSDYLIDLPPRELGDTRLFQIWDGPEKRWILVNAVLRHIGEHSYIYFASIGQNWSPNLQSIGDVFDNEIYSPLLSLWDLDRVPSYEGDERVVILTLQGYDRGGSEWGYYSGRQRMPGEVRPDAHRVGYMGITMGAGSSRAILAHEFFHMIQHLADRNESLWVNESLARFTEYYLGYDDPLYHSTFFNINKARFPLLSDPTYSAGLVFFYYILERLGLETLQAMLKRPENGLAALDAVLAEMGSGMSAASLYADWVLANYLYDPTLGDGRYGYTILSSFTPEAQPPIPHAFITETPFQPLQFAESSLLQYSTHYYEISLSATEAVPQLEMTLALSGSASQDAWLQLAQVIDGEVSLQRFRASDYRNRAIGVTLSENSERTVLALSLFDSEPVNHNPHASFRLSIRVPGVDNGRAVADTPSNQSVTIADRAEETELTLAAAAGDFVRVGELLLEEKVNPDQHMNLGHEAALRLAAAAGHDNVVALLLLTAVDIHSQDAAGNTARILAEQAGHPKVLKLLEIAAEKKLINRRPAASITMEEQRAFIAATRAGNLAEIERLLADGVHPDIRDDTRTSPLMLASQRGFIDLTLRLLLEDASPNMSGHDLYIPLHYAIQYGHSDIAAMLLLGGMSMNRTPRTYSKTLSPLHLAAQYGRPEIVRLLLNSIHRGEQVNALGNSGKTALYYASPFADGITKSLETSIAIVELLLDAGADPTLADWSGSVSPLESARQYGPYAIFQLYYAAASKSN